MRWNRYFRPLLVFALVTAGSLVFLLPTRGQRPVQAAGQPAPPKVAGKAPSQPAADAAAGVRQAVADYVAALNKGDLKGVMAFWAPDAEYIPESGNATHGRQGISDLFKEVLPQIKGHKVTGEMASVRLLDPGVALQEGSLVYADGDGGKDVSRYSAIWVKADGKWLISSARDLPAGAVADASMGYAQLRPLEWLVGEWTEAAGKGDVKLSCHWGPNKAFLLMDYQIRREGQDPLTVNVRIGWDGHNGLVRSWMFDSNGGFGEGNWGRDGRRWIVECAGVLPDGGTGGSTNAWEYVDGNTFVWRATDREVDGQPVGDVEIKFVRKGQKTETKP